MRIPRVIAGLFASGAVALALLLAAEPAGSNTLLVASSGCGGYSGPVCSQTRSCVWYLFGQICTTKYTYYPGQEQKQKEKPTGREKEVHRPASWPL